MGDFQAGVDGPLGWDTWAIGRKGLEMWPEYDDQDRVIAEWSIRDGVVHGGPDDGTRIVGTAPSGARWTVDAKLTLE